MTMIRTSMIAAFGMLALGSILPAAAAVPAATSGVTLGETAGVQPVTDRGSWIKPGRDWDRDYRRGIDRYDDHHHRKHFKKKRWKRSYKKGYRRGYEEGYRDSRRRSYFERPRHRHRHYYPHSGFRGGIYFGDGNFRFRY